MPTSFHYEQYRKEREKFIKAHEYDKGKTIACFRVVKGEGIPPQIHVVTSTGLIIVKDMRGRVITKMIARPEQIKRLYRDVGLEPPEEVMMLAYLHNVNGYNKK